MSPDRLGAKPFRADLLFKFAALLSKIVLTIAEQEIYSARHLLRFISAKVNTDSLYYHNIGGIQAGEVNEARRGWRRSKFAAGKEARVVPWANVSNQGPAHCGQSNHPSFLTAPTGGAPSPVGLSVWNEDPYFFPKRKMIPAETRTLFCLKLKKGVTT